MRDDFGYMAELPGTPLEQAWVREYLETISEWERIVLAASAARRPPASAKDAVNHLLSLHGGSVYLAAGDYEGLGSWSAPVMSECKAMRRTCWKPPASC